MDRERTFIVSCTLSRSDKGIAFLECIEGTRTGKSDAKIEGKVSVLAGNDAIIIPLPSQKESNDEKDNVVSSRKERQCMASCRNTVSSNELPVQRLVADFLQDESL